MGERLAAESGPGDPAMALGNAGWIATAMRAGQVNWSDVDREVK
jgi:hypothetical protein